jgi:hypothetical protein
MISAGLSVPLLADSGPLPWLSKGGTGCQQRGRQCAPHFLAYHRHKATLPERRNRADAKAMRGQKRLRRTVGARSGDYSERVTLLGSERHGLFPFRSDGRPRGHEEESLSSPHFVAISD